MKGKRKLFRAVFGPHGKSVAVFELYLGSNLHLEWWNPETGKTERLALGHKDQALGMHQAREKAEQLAAGETPAPDIVTVAHLFSQYLTTATPDKKPSQQQFDHRAAEMAARIFGPLTDVFAITSGDWQRFLSGRLSGKLNAQGEEVPESDRQPVRPGTAREDAVFFKAVANWATKFKIGFQGGRDRYLLEASPFRAFPLPKVRDQRRPVASQDRLEKLLAVAPSITMEMRGDGKRHQVRSFLWELLVLLNGTGRRVSAVLGLTFADLLLNRGPFGSIRWVAALDKVGREWVTPMNAQARDAIDFILRTRPGVGATPLFPSPRSPSRPCGKDLVSAWLEKCERAAGVPKMDGSLWHAYRRKFATERKGYADADVMRLGGWSDITSLKTAYQQADDASLIEAITKPRELRERKA